MCELMMACTTIRLKPFLLNPPYPPLLHSSMAPKRKRSLYEIFPELQHMARKELVSFLKRVADNREEMESTYSSYWGLDKDFHANFDLVACSDMFPYADKPGGFNMEYADPGLLVQLVLTKCTKLAQRWVTALRHHKGTPSDPWSCILGFDEFQPGDKLSFDREKAVMCLYFNFAEVDAASQGSTWFCPVSVGSAQADSVVVGWSRLLSCILHRMFLVTNGFSTVCIALI